MEHPRSVGPPDRPPIDPVGVAACTAHYDDRAPRYDDSAMHRSLATEVAGLVLTGVTERAVVLDVGTGTGLVLRALAGPTGSTPTALTPTAAGPAASGLRLLGVDRSPGMLARARAADPRLEVVRADAARLPLPDGVADVVTGVTVLHLLPDRRAALREWARVARPGARLWTATFAPNPDVPPAPTAGRGAPPFPRDHAAVATRERLADLATGTGWTLTDTRVSRHDRDLVLVAGFERC